MHRIINKMECIVCQGPYSGNENKKFCSDKCKNDFHNARRKQESREIGRVVNILRTNRRILAGLLAENQIRSVPENRLLEKGFIFRYHTHRRINKGDGKEYVFCFDYGYLSTGTGWYKILKAFSEE